MHRGCAEAWFKGAAALLDDPLGFDAGDSNLYRYVHNAPTNATDPSGLDRIFVGADGTVYWQVQKPGSIFGSTWQNDVGSPIPIGWKNRAGAGDDNLVHIDKKLGGFDVPLQALQNLASGGSLLSGGKPSAFGNGSGSVYDTTNLTDNSTSALTSRVNSTIRGIPRQVQAINDALDLETKRMKAESPTIGPTQGTPEWWAYQDATLKRLGYGVGYRLIFRIFMPVEGSGINTLNDVGAGIVGLRGLGGVASSCASTMRSRRGGPSGGSGSSTPVTSGTGSTPRTSTPNSIYEQFSSSGQLMRRSYYDASGNMFSSEHYSQTSPHYVTIGGTRYNLANAPHQHELRTLTAPNGTTYQRWQVRIIDQDGRPLTEWVNSGPG